MYTIRGSSPLSQWCILHILPDDDDGSLPEGSFIGVMPPGDEMSEVVSHCLPHRLGEQLVQGRYAVAWGRFEPATLRLQATEHIPTPLRSIFPLFQAKFMNLPPTFVLFRFLVSPYFDYMMHLHIMLNMYWTPTAEHVLRKIHHCTFRAKYFLRDFLYPKWHKKFHFIPEKFWWFFFSHQPQI